MRERLLPRGAAGDLRLGWAFGEDSGANYGGIKTRFETSPNGFKVTGRQTMVTGADCFE